MCKVSESSNSLPIPNSELLENLRFIARRYTDQNVQGFMAIFYLLCCIFPEYVESKSLELEIIIRSEDLPLGAGLGSSAAFSVALAGCILRTKELFNLSNYGKILDETDLKKKLRPNDTVLEVVNRWAYGS